MAREGLGIEDLVVVCRMRRGYAKRIVWSVENERARRNDNEPQLSNVRRAYAAKITSAS